MSKKRVALTIVGILVLAAIIFLVVRFKQSDKSVAEHVVPQLKLAHMQVTNLTADRANINMNMLIDNPAPIGLKIDSLHYTIFIADNEVARSTYPDSLQIESNDSTSVSLPLTLYYDKLESVLKSLEQQGRDSAMYKIEATIFSDMDIIPKDKLNLTVEKRLPLIRMMDVKVTDLRVNDLSFSGATLNLVAAVTNKNIFDMGFKNMSYSVQIEDNETVEGNKPGTVVIPAKGSATITIPAELSFKEMGKTLFDMLRKGDDVRYEFNMSTELVSNAHVLEDSKMKMSASGKLKAVTNAVEENMEEKEDKE